MIVRPIPGFPGYFATEEGGIIGPAGAVLTPMVTRDGYHRVNIHPHRGMHLVNRLVAVAFHGEPPTPQHHAAHRDGNPANNVPGNVRWATALENAQDKHLHGRTSRGEHRPAAKLTAAKVAEARYLHAEGWSFWSLGRRFGVSASTARRAVQGETWAHIPTA